LARHISFESMTITDISTVLAIISGSFALIKGVLEYSRQAAQKRAEHLIRLRRDFYEQKGFDEIREMLAQDDPALAKVDVQKRLHFLSFIDELALLVKSGLVSKEIAYYMFGFFVIKSVENKAMWAGIIKPERGDDWEIFNQLYNQMSAIRKNGVEDWQRVKF